MRPMNSKNRILIFMLLFTFLSGCWWQEQLCYIGKDPQLIKKEFYYDDCDAISDSALRGRLLNE